MFRRPQAANVMDLRRPAKKKRPWIPVFIVALIALLAALALVVMSSFSQAHSPVPSSVKKKVDFSIYYPANLPPGFVLNTDSFNASDVAVVYTVTYHGDRKLVFTIQTKPSDNDIATFYKNQMPINRKVDTSVGQATVGAINLISAASLPTKDAWVIITDPKPPLISRDQFDKVLQGMKKA